MSLRDKTSQNHNQGSEVDNIFH